MSKIKKKEFELITTERLEKTCQKDSRLCCQFEQQKKKVTESVVS